ncbi:SAM-dependent methyltransferase [Geobacillus thermodenitrificans]|uniref:class I SAM-dependent methyltransferase n=1 Tax=Geobacillus thermodenitrificans TaxID=33940 RepID=UPI00017E3A72|nr:class I SAM-dependent methyltransferase [Geobacillus thermodenitrificans]PJW22439.1 SAM-dependent methyltransferase [Geobacillus thermodenitrificans]
MKPNEPSMTALMSCFVRAYHTEHDTPVIFRDDMARQLITDEEYKQIQTFLANGLGFFAPERLDAFSSDEEKVKWIVQTQLAPTPIARAAYIERIIHHEKRLGATQYVILGAGLDTFAFRHPNSGLTIFEVDHPNTQQFKRERIHMANWKMPNCLQLVAADFTKDDVAPRLLAAGFRPSEKTVFSLLGFSYYLEKEHFYRLLHQLAPLMTEGSSIVFDFADEQLFTSPVKRVQNTLALAQQSGEPMKAAYSIKELEQQLQYDHLLIFEHVSPQQIQTQFFSNRNDDLTAFEHTHYLHAVRK